MSRLIAFAIPVASACAYAPGSFSGPQSSFPGTRTTVGCLDVAVAVVSSTQQQGSVIQYTVGNRCDRVATVDFSAVHARSAAGASLGPRMAPFDPRAELRPLRMEARTVITEAIEYRHVTPGIGDGVCIDVAQLDGPARGERWLCRASAPIRGGAR